MELKPWLHRVQYYETDQMAVVHHSNYIRWFEESRTDWFEQLNLPMRMVEGQGIMIPVVSCQAKYIISARLGDEVEIHPKKELYNGVVLKISYEVIDPKTGKCMATGESVHCFTTRDGKVLNLKRKYPDIHAILQQA